MTDLNGLLLDCNLTALELFGYSPDEKKEKYLNKVHVTDYYVNSDKRRQFIAEGDHTREQPSGDGL